MNIIAKLILLLSFLIAVNMVSGQIQFGVTGGIGGATQSDFGNIYDNDDIGTGFNAGITIRKSFNETFALKTNLLYELKGSSYDVLKNGESLKQKDKFTYLTLPVKAEYSIPLLKDRLFAAAGPYAGILLNAKQKVEGISNNINEAKDFDFGLALEFGYSKPISESELQFSFSYDMGLTKIVEYDKDIRNKALCINIGLLF